MKRKLSLVLFLTCLAGLSTVLAQDKLTLEQAIDLALKNSQVVQIAGESVTGAAARINESKSLYYPQLSVGGNYTRMSVLSKIQFPLGDKVYNISFGIPDNYSFRAGVIQQVFNWGRTKKTVELNTQSLELAKDAVTLTRQMVTYQVVPVFYGVFFLKEAIKVLDDNLKLFEKRIDILTERYNAGLASSFDISLIQVQVSTLKEQRLDFENSIRKLNVSYNALAGRPQEAAFDPVGEFSFNPLSLDKGELLKSALAQRPEFEQIAHQEQVAQTSIDLAKTGNKPTIAFTANYELRNGFFPDMTQVRGNWNAGLTVSYPLFDGFRERAQIAEGQSSLRAVELRRKDLERNVEMEIETNLSDLRTLEQKIEIDKLKIKQAEDALKIAEERYQNGLLSAVDFIESQNALESAQLNDLQLIYDHFLGTYNLYRAVGKRIAE